MNQPEGSPPNEVSAREQEQPDDPLQALGRRRNYEWTAGESFTCLLWTDRAASPAKNRYLDRLFWPGSFSSPDFFWLDASFVTKFLSDSALPSVFTNEFTKNIWQGTPAAQFLLWRIVEKAGDQAAQRIEQELRQHFADAFYKETGRITQDKQSDLTAQQNEAREKLLEHKSKLEPVHEKIRRILKVYYVEGVRHMASVPGPESYQSIKHSAEEIQQFTHELRMLWGHVKMGMSSWAVKRALPIPMPLPDYFVDAQCSALHHYLEEHDRVVEESMPDFYKWAELARISGQLGGEPVDEAEEAKSDQNSTDQHIIKHSSSGERNWKKMKIAVATTLLIPRSGDSEGFGIDPRWEGATERELMAASNSKLDSRLKSEAEKPGKGLAERVKARMKSHGECPPTGRGASKWVPIAKEWADDLRIHPMRFDSPKD